MMYRRGFTWYGWPIFRAEYKEPRYEMGRILLTPHAWEELGWPDTITVTVEA
jgi:hypothetical protein